MAHIRIEAVGGYGEVGKNMTAIHIDDETIICDMGMHMDHLLTHIPDSDLASHSREDMIRMEIIPDDSHIDVKRVKAIIPSHGHLDHIAGIPYLESRYNCPIYATPFTAEVLKRQFKDNGFKRKNKIFSVLYGKQIKLSEKITIEFVYVTHSVPHSSIVAIHTPYGTVCYANDYKFDDEPLGEISDYKRLKEIGKNCVCLISECLYARKEGRTPFEAHVKEQLAELMYKYNKKGIFVTTFTSHITRLQMIYDIAKSMKRKVMFLGRSLDKYALSAKFAKVTNMVDGVEMYPYKSQIKRKLKNLGNDKKNYVIVLTGHQAEEHAVLNSMLNGKLPNPFAPDDLFIFSCNIIPTDAIQKARAELELKLEKTHMVVHKDIHVSGHAHIDDLQMLVKMLKPKVVIPSHGTQEMMDAYVKNVAIPLKIEVKQIHTGESVKIA
jgi:ribonuclease J